MTTRMREIDGFELVARSRAQPKFATAKLIALTGYGQTSDRAHGKDAGFGKYRERDRASKRERGWQFSRYGH